MGLFKVKDKKQKRIQSAFVGVGAGGGVEGRALSNPLSTQNYIFIGNFGYI